MRTHPSKDNLQLPSLPIHLVEALAQVSVNHALHEHGLTRKVYASGDGFANFDRWPLLLFLRALLEWYETNPAQDLDEEVLLKLVETVNGTTLESILEDSPIRNPHILVPEVWVKTPDFFDTVIQGGAYHEAWHTLYSKRGPLDSDLVVKRFGPRLPPRTLITPVRKTFLKALWNILEDTMIEQQGTSALPETRAILCTLMDHVQEREQQAREEGELSACSVFMGLLRDLARGYNLASVQQTLRAYQAAYPKIVAEFDEKGMFYPFLERAWKLADSIEVMELFFDLWKFLDEQTEGISLPGPSDPESGKNKRGSGEGKGKGASQEEGNGEGGGSGKNQERNPSTENPEDSDSGEGLPEGDSSSTMEAPSSGGHGGLEDSQTEGPQDKDLSMGDLCSQILDCPTRWYHFTIDALIRDFLEQLAKTQQAVSQPLLPGEKKWNPQSIREDTITVAPKGDLQSSLQRLKEVQPIVAAIRTRLRTLFIAHRLPQKHDGLPKGRKLSRKFIVETYGLLQANETPKRAFQAETPAPRQDMAVVLVTDESGSMSSVRQPLIQAFLALAESLSSVGQMVFALGIRSKHSWSREPEPERKNSTDGFHRTHAVDYLIYQRWGEPFQTVSQRFDSVRPNGSTPLSDGLHFGLDLLRRRPEPHRIVFVLTDGDPDPGHAPVIRYDSRTAKSEGIHIVGIGIGVHSSNMKELFEDHVIINSPGELPGGLMQKLYELCHARISAPANR